MTTKEAAAVLGVSVGRVKHLITNGTLTAVSRPRVGKGGNEWHIDRATVDVYAARERKPGRPPKISSGPASRAISIDR